MATYEEALTILEQMQANNDPNFIAARDSVQRQLDANRAQEAQQQQEYRRLSYQSQPGPHWAGASSVGYAPPQIGYDTPKDTSFWGRIKDTASDAIQAIPRTPPVPIPGTDGFQLNPLDPLIGALQSGERANFGDHTWSGLQQLPHAAERSYDLVNLQHLMRQGAVSPTTFGRSAGDSNLPVPPDLTWAPDGPVINRASFDSMEPVVRPPMTQDGAQAQDWRMHRANRPGFDNARVNAEIQAQAPGLVANIMQQGRNIEEIREKTRGESGDFSGGLKNIMGDSPNTGFADHIGVLKRVYENPEAAWATFGESLGYSLPTLLTSLFVGWASAPFRVLASSGVALPGAFATEMSFASEEVLQQLGIDINNPEHLKALMEDPSMMAAATNAMKTKASVIAAFESIGIGASVKLGSMAARAKTLSRAAGLGAAGIGSQMVTEAGGEGFGTKLATGKTDMPGYMLEGLMGAGGGMIITIPTAMQGAFGGRTAQVKDVIRLLVKAKQKMVASGTIDDKQFTILSETQAALEDSQLSPREKAVALEKLNEAANQGGLNTDIVLDLGIDLTSTVDQAVEAGAAVQMPEPVSGAVIDESANIGAALEQRGQPTRQVPVAAKTTPVSVFDADAILRSLQQEMDGIRVTRRMVKQRAMELLGHEVQVHGALRAAFTALGLKTGDVDKFLNDVASKYETEIRDWLKNTPRGRLYVLDAKGKPESRTLRAEEWIANDLKAKSEKGKFVRLIQRKFKQEASLDITGKDIKELYNLIDALQRQSEGKSTTITPPTGSTPQTPEIVTPASYEARPQLDGETFEADTSRVDTETPDTSQADLDAAVAERQVQETILDEQLSSVERSTFGNTRFAKGPDIDNRRQTAIAKAMAPNKHIRESDLRMNAIKENWEDNKDDLEFRRDYANFKEFEQAEWDLNYDMWIDEVQEAEAEETDTSVTQLEVDPSIEELRAAREATQLQLTQINEQLASLERDTMGDTRFAKAADPETDTSKADLEDATRERVLQETILEEQLSGFERDFTGETRFAKAADLDAAGILNRNVRNDFAKGPYKDITERADEAEIRARIKRLGNLYGPMGQKRGVEPGDRATAKEQAQNAIDNVDAFEEFMAPFEEQMQAQPAESKTATGRQKKYAERKGITVADILSYRDRGKTHPMEKKMSYSFAMDEINRLEEAGEATAEEAEARRRALNDLRNQLGGKMPPGAKRKATEITYGIGDYANLEAWDYTDTETAGMEERAEVARGQERVRGLSRTKKTEQELEEITGTDVTPTEMLQIASMAEVEAFDHLRSDEARLRYLREKEAMPASERDALDAFMKDIKGWNQKAYEEQVAAELEAQVEKVGVTKVEQTPAQRKTELKDIKEAQAPIDKRKHMQVEPDFFDTLVDTNFTMQGESVPDGFMELTEDGEWSEVDDTDTSTRYAKALGAPGEWVLHNAWGPGKIVDSNVDNTTIEFLSLDKPKIMPNNMGHFLGEAPQNIDELEKQLKSDAAPTREMMSAGIKRILKADEYFRQDRFWHANDTSNTEEFAKLRNAEKMYDLISAKSAGTDIDRAVQEGASDRGDYISFIDSSRVKLNREIKTKDNEIPFLVDHVQELVTEMQRLHIAMGDFHLGRDVTANQVLVIHPMHVMKTNYNNIKKYGGGPQSERRDSETAFTDMQKFMNSKSVQANLFNKKHAKDFGIKEQDLLTKVDKYLATTKAKDDGKMFSRLLKAHDGWHGTTSSDKAKRVASELDTNLDKQDDGKLVEEYEATLTRYAKRSKGDSYEEHFNKSFWYTLTSYLWGKPVQAIRDFNKLSRFGQAKADIPAADEIADEVQRAHSSTQRAGDLVYGTDIVQDTSIMTGRFYTRLAQIFSRVTARFGDIETKENQILVDVLTGKIRIEEIDNAEVREAAELLRELIQEVYDYAKTETKGLKKPLDLRGHGDTLLPRVWNIEFLATRRGKAKFLKAIRAAISDPATGSSILEDSELTVEDLFNVVVNSGGFVQGDWTNLKADQTRDQKDIDKDLRAQEYLDALPTESLIDEDLVMIDLQAIIPRFLQKAVERTEYSKRFGVNDEILRAKIKEGLEQIKVHNAKVLKLDKTDTSLTYIDPRAFEKSIWDMARILRNKYGYDMANMQTRAWLQRVVNFEVVAKLPLVTLASMPELFTPMLRGDVRADKWIVDFMMGLSWAGYKGMNGISKLLLNKHLPAMRKMSKDIGGIGVVSDMQLLRELGIAEIQAMGDSVSTRYANPNFARGGLRAGARTTIAGRIPKKVRAVFNMQTYMQATLLTTLTEMQQLMALRNFQRHMAKRVKFVQKNKDKELKGRRLRLFKQFSKDMADFGLPQNIDLSTPAGEAEFNAGAIRFVDQVITRPNDATTAKAFKNPLTAPIFLFKRFITTFGNTLMTAVGNDIATKVDNIEKAKQVGRVATTMVAMYGAVMFAEIIRGAIKGDLDEDDMTVTGGDFRTFVRRVDRTGLLSAPGAMLLNLSFPYKRGWWDSPEARIWGELGGPIGGDLSALMKTGFDRRPGSAQRLIRQMIPMSKQLIDLPPKKKRASKSKTRKVKIPKLTY